MYKINNTYEIDYLVNRFCDKYKSITGNSNMGISKTVIKAPEIQTINKKIYLKNFENVCSSINRDPQHVSAYISKELQVQVSITADQVLVINGSYRKNQIESIVKKYVANFVQCTLCGTQDTIIEKKNRITYIICNKCHARVAIS